MVAGTFLVVGLGEEDFASLSPKLTQKYEELFHQPENFMRLGRQMLVLPVPDGNGKSKAPGGARTMRRYSCRGGGINAGGS